MSRKKFFIIILILACILPSTLVMAKGPGGGGHTDVSSNNLSVPTIMIGGGFTGVTCPGALVEPSGTPLAGYELAPTDFYFVQGVHTWQAECATATFATATAEWGDNLEGDAKLQVGKPIRVELGLFDDTNLQMYGFNVVKLQPSELDRVSAYGTLAQPVLNELGEVISYEATAEYLPVRVYDSEVTFSVQNLTTEAYVVPIGSDPTAEINATGKVVYGYNLRVTAAGQYKITFVLPNVNITGVDIGEFTTSATEPDTVSIIITVVGGGGGGGSGGWGKH